MKKVMLIQPMGNRSEEDIMRERNMFSKILKEYGYEVIDTYFKENPPQNVNAGLYYLGKSISAMSEADLVILLPNWDKAKGCKIEYACTKAYGIETLEIQLEAD